MRLMVFYLFSSPLDQMEPLTLLAAPRRDDDGGREKDTKRWGDRPQWVGVVGTRPQGGEENVKEKQQAAKGKWVGAASVPINIPLPVNGKGKSENANPLPAMNGNMCASHFLPRLRMSGLV